MSLRTFVSFFAFLTLPLSAESRPWKSADGVRTIQGEFVKRDATSVTIKLADGKEVVCDLTKLHADEKKWLDLHHSVNMPDANAVFDTLKFGDPHAIVLEKLKASKMLEMTIDSQLVGRVGLNGIFRIRQKVGGLDALLYFDWNEAEQLKEINVRTAAFPAAAYDQKLAPSWREFIELLEALQGKPIQAATIDLAAVPNGSMVCSHLWRLDGGGSAMLGVGREGGDYQVVVRFTKEKIEPVAPTGRAKAPGPDFDFNP